MIKITDSGHGVKKISLIRDERPFWSTVERYLNEVNAEVSTRGGHPDPGSILDSSPDLIITSARIHHELGTRVRHFPTIVIKEGTPPVVLARKTKERNTLIIGWPLEKGQLLEITSRMLFVAPRKKFRALIRIFTEGDVLGSFGQSRDFSITGVAFKTEKSLRKGERIDMSFNISDTSGSLRLGAEVVRSSNGRENDNILYGACFVALSPNNRRIMNDFVRRD